MTPPFVYALVDPNTGRVRYIGMSMKGKGRPYQHTKNARKGKESHLCNWIRALLRGGLEPTIRILEQCSVGASREAVGLRERYFIHQFRTEGHPLINHTEGGEGGWNHDAETRDRIKIARARQQMPAYTEERRAKLSATLKGHVVSPETRARLSATFARIRAAKPAKVKVKVPRKAVQGHSQTPETRAKISAARKDIQFSDETKAKMSVAKKGKPGRPMSAETREKIRQSITRMWADGKRNSGVAQ